MGFVNINHFANWVCENCGFHICDEDLPLLEKALDGVNDYRITKEGFIETVSVPVEEEDEPEAAQPQPGQQEKAKEASAQKEAAPQ